MQNWLEEKGELEGCITSAIQRLDQAFPFPEHENRDWMKYLPHAKAALELRGHSADKRVQARPDAVRRALRLYRKERSTDRAEAGLFANVAESHYMLGKYQAAEQMYRKALELQKAALGKDHPDTLTSMNNLANVLNSLGKYKMAEKMHRQILKLRKAVLGKDYPDTLISINNLANVLDSRGKYEEAEQIYRQTLELQKAVLGKDHPDTLTRMNNLAIVLRRLGTYGEAGQMHRHTLKLREPGAR
ncbi:kinesin light chain 1 [Metarhizium acridum CQMa 102]|uniref:Kinesin light chain 1 n=1 Tax=Metarhizium acridum (strain CQMa 102) TaxID=655827 RepID=E9E7N9_METAQ|nr:kinesin light chain 1 [Metarhizium acridum CQMa 102]EFY88023.1 kinesin light chain 1 [Metarhizium acridum CQMa 102]